MTANGDIYPAVEDDSAANETISRLGLNLSVLNASRKAAIRAIVDDLDELSSDDLRTLADEFLARDNDGLFAEYCVAIVYVLRSLIPG